MKRALKTVARIMLGVCLLSTCGVGAAQVGGGVHPLEVRFRSDGPPAPGWKAREGTLELKAGLDPAGFPGSGQAKLVVETVSGPPQVLMGGRRPVTVSYNISDSQLVIELPFRRDTERDYSFHIAVEIKDHDGTAHAFERAERVTIEHLPRRELQVEVEGDPYEARGNLRLAAEVDPAVFPETGSAILQVGGDTRGVLAGGMVDYRVQDGTLAATPEFTRDGNRAVELQPILWVKGRNGREHVFVGGRVTIGQTEAPEVGALHLEVTGEPCEADGLLKMVASVDPSRFPRTGKGNLEVTGISGPGTVLSGGDVEYSIEDEVLTASRSFFRDSTDASIFDAQLLVEDISGDAHLFVGRGTIEPCARPSRLVSRVEGRSFAASGVLYITASVDTALFPESGSSTLELKDRRGSAGEIEAGPLEYERDGGSLTVSRSFSRAWWGSPLEFVPLLKIEDRTGITHFFQGEETKIESRSGRFGWRIIVVVIPVVVALTSWRVARSRRFRARPGVDAEELREQVAPPASPPEAGSAEAPLSRREMLETFERVQEGLTERVTALQNRLDEELSTRLKALSEKRDTGEGVSGEIDDASVSRIDRLERLLGGEEGLRILEGDWEKPALLAFVKELSERASELSQGLKEQGRHVDRTVRESVDRVMAARTDEAAERVAELERTQGEWSRKIDGLSGRLDKLQKAVEAAERVAELERAQGEWSRKTDGLSGRLDKLQKAVEAAERVAELERTQEECSGHIDGLAGRLDGIEKTVSDLGGLVRRVENVVSSAQVSAKEVSGEPRPVEDEVPAASRPSVTLPDGWERIISMTVERISTHGPAEVSDEETQLRNLLGLKQALEKLSALSESGLVVRLVHLIPEESDPTRIRAHDTGAIGKGKKTSVACEECGSLSSTLLFQLFAMVKREDLEGEVLVLIPPGPFDGGRYPEGYRALMESVPSEPVVISSLKEPAWLETTEEDPSLYEVRLKMKVECS